RMSELQAAFAAAQFERLEDIAAKRGRLGNLLSESIAKAPGIVTQMIRPDDRCTYWIYIMRMEPKALRCSMEQFAKAVSAEGASVAAGYIPVPLYGNPIFQRHGFFAGRWPIKDLGLTSMDYTKVHCPEAEAILKTCMRVAVHEGMNEEYILSVASAITKVANH